MVRGHACARPRKGSERYLSPDLVIGRIYVRQSEPKTIVGLGSNGTRREPFRNYRIGHRFGGVAIVLQYPVIHSVTPSHRLRAPCKHIEQTQADEFYETIALQSVPIAALRHDLPEPHSIDIRVIHRLRGFAELDGFAGTSINKQLIVHIHTLAPRDLLRQLLHRLRQRSERIPEPILVALIAR